jgi:hypothetical protein
MSWHASQVIQSSSIQTFAIMDIRATGAQACAEQSFHLRTAFQVYHKPTIKLRQRNIFKTLYCNRKTTTKNGVNRLHIWKSPIPPMPSPIGTPLDEITSSILKIMIAVSVAD